MIRGVSQGLVWEPIKNDMIDYEEYEQQCELIRKENQVILDAFESWLLTRHQYR